MQPAFEGEEATHEKDWRKKKSEERLSMPHSEIS